MRALSLLLLRLLFFYFCEAGFASRARTHAQCTPRSGGSCASSCVPRCCPPTCRGTRGCWRAFRRAWRRLRCQPPARRASRRSFRRPSRRCALFLAARPTTGACSWRSSCMRRYENSHFLKFFPRSSCFLDLHHILTPVPGPVLPAAAAPRVRARRRVPVRRVCTTGPRGAVAGSPCVRHGGHHRARQGGHGKIIHLCGRNKPLCRPLVLHICGSLLTPRVSFSAPPPPSSICCAPAVQASCRNLAAARGHADAHRRQPRGVGHRGAAVEARSEGSPCVTEAAPRAHGVSNTVVNT